MKKIKILCTICARKGSKGLKNKNLLKLLDKPLIMHTIEQARMIKYFSKIIVSSDSKKIIEISKNKVDHCILRPKKLSNDQSSKVDAIQHALLMSENKFDQSFDLIVDLDVTSPLRSTNDISKAIKMFLKKKPGNLVSGTEAKKNPYFNQVMFRNNKLSVVNKPKKKIVRRQDAPKIFDLNASIYIWSRKNLLSSKRLINEKTIFYKMPSISSIDIDNKLDFMMVSYILKKKL
jgi:CMP-N,N'-diacetyllegionaminic acid synthase